MVGLLSTSTCLSSLQKDVCVMGNNDSASVKGLFPSYHVIMPQMLEFSL